MNARPVCLIVSALLLLTAAEGPISAQDDPNLVARWAFDEGPGATILDSSGNKNHGTPVGGLQWVPLDEGGAMEFDGNSGHITIPFSESLRLLNQGDFTLTAWFKAGTVPEENKEVFQQGDGTGTGRTWLFAANGGEIRSYLGGATTASAINVETDTWYHAAVVVTESGPTDSVQVYVNGQPAGDPSEFGMEDADGIYYIGCHKNLTNFWDGVIDDVRLYNRALTDEEIAAMVPPKLKAYDPIPADGDVAVVAPLLQWTAGDTALLHDVYLGTDPNLGPDDQVQSRIPVNLYFHMDGIAPGTTYYWRVDEVEADMTTVHTGDVWTFVAQPYTAYLPGPADGVNDVAPDPNLALAWQAGRDALQHQVYFGPTFDDVNDGAASADRGVLDGTTFVLPEALEPLTAYYWRVDEVGFDDALETGDVWSFTTYLSVDDFEGYGDEIGERVFEAWVDGIGFSQPEPGDPGNGTGAAVGHDVWSPDNPHFGGSIMETALVYDGGQAMPLYYDNSADPFYSEAIRTWTSPQNWTAGGADTLALHVSGDMTNAAEPLYVALEDTTGRVGIAVHPDSAAVANRGWTRWSIPLSPFADAGVNLTAIRKMIIGLGDRTAPAAGGAGLVLVDAIFLTRPGAAEE
jgi:hypothetical protein